jgi:DNA-binding transcriptional ArsR family regulator
MAIPDWRWSNASFRDQQTQSSTELLQESEIEAATGVFEVLSNTTRLEILAALYNQSDSLSYTELRNSTSVSDKGKFNYHLRQLEHLVQNQDGAYTLSDRGEELMRSVLSETEICRY